MGLRPVISGNILTGFSAWKPITVSSPRPPADLLCHARIISSPSAQTSILPRIDDSPFAQRLGDRLGYTPARRRMVNQI